MVAQRAHPIELSIPRARPGFAPADNPIQPVDIIRQIHRTKHRLNRDKKASCLPREKLADPFVCDLPRLEWKGELGDLGDGIMLTAVSVEMTAEPPSYRCTIETRDARGIVETLTLVWRPD